MRQKQPQVVQAPLVPRFGSVFVLSADGIVQYSRSFLSDYKAVAVDDQLTKFIYSILDNIQYEYRNQAQKDYLLTFDLTKREQFHSFSQRLGYFVHCFRTVNNSTFVLMHSEQMRPGSDDALKQFFFHLYHCYLIEEMNPFFRTHNTIQEDNPALDEEVLKAFRMLKLAPLVK